MKTGKAIIFSLQYSVHGGLGIGHYVMSAKFNVCFFHEQMPFSKKVIEDLYNSIVKDEVEYTGKLSEIAWNLLTQVGRHSAKLTLER